MRKIVLLFACFVTGLSFSQDIKLKVEVVGLENDKGKVFIGLCNDKNTFLVNFYQGRIIKSKNNKVSVEFTGLRKGEYAVSVFHDENDNGKIDRNILGIPSEAYNTSNDAKNLFSAPKYEDAKFMLTEDKTVIIRL